MRTMEVARGLMPRSEELGRQGEKRTTAQHPEMTDHDRFWNQKDSSALVSSVARYPPLCLFHRWRPWSVVLLVLSDADAAERG